MVYVDKALMTSNDTVSVAYTQLALGALSRMTDLNYQLYVGAGGMPPVHSTITAIRDIVLADACPGTVDANACAQVYFGVLRKGLFASVQAFTSLVSANSLRCVHPSLSDLAHVHVTTLQPASCS